MQTSRKHLLAQPELSPPPGWSLVDSKEMGVALSHLLSGATPVVFHYQPIVDLRRGVVAGYEALVRFPAAMGPTPDLCFEASRSYGKRLELEEVVARTALVQKRLLPNDCFFCINLSAIFLVSPHWQRVLASVTDLAGFVIEITEEESISDYDDVRRKLAQIRDLGGCVAVDDAGSGYASLKHIVEMKPSFIKLDRMFISRCQAEPAKSVMIEMMGQAANRLDAWMIAEGIESQQELDELIHLGLPLGQGYFLGRPDPVMQPLAPEAAAAIRSRIQRQAQTDGLLPLVESCPVFPSRDAALALLATTTAATVAVLDQWSRPAQIIERHPALGVRAVPELMKIQLASDPVEVMYRLLTRALPCRFDPIAVIDAQGMLQGIVRVDRLMRHVLDGGHAASTRNTAARADTR